jgi:hypothetical protein
MFFFGTAIPKRTKSEFCHQKCVSRQNANEKRKKMGTAPALAWPETWFPHSFCSHGAARFTESLRVRRPARRIAAISA